MFIFNVLLTHELRSPKLQSMKYQCLFSMYYHYANSAVLSCNSQWSMFVYYQCIIMYYYFRSLTINRELQEIGANQAEFAPFDHILRE